jgi:hypothetical protein
MRGTRISSEICSTLKQKDSSDVDRRDMKNLIEQLLAVIFIVVLGMVVYKLLPKAPAGILADKEGFSNAGEKITPEGLKGEYEIVAGPGTADLKSS